MREGSSKERPLERRLSISGVFYIGRTPESGCPARNRAAIRDFVAIGQRGDLALRESRLREENRAFGKAPAARRFRHISIRAIQHIRAEITECF
jgi:hypothetical protein